MGAKVFHQVGRGSTAQEAFKNAREDAYYDFGHRGYTGTLAEKDSFVEINIPEGSDPYEYADKLIHDSDHRIDDKWGPAGCIKMEEGKYLFFGWASC